MSNKLPLKPLVWIKDATYNNRHSSINGLHYYGIEFNGWSSKYEVEYESEDGRPATGFSTAENAKAWAWDNYQAKMQPYIDPIGKWLSIEDGLPDVECDTQFLCAYPAGFFNSIKIVNFNVDIGEFDYQHKDIAGYMPLPDMPKMSEV